ncbi:MAG: hypothetical protein OHK0046_01130 [Anaerolineae bacterium]
MSERFDETQEIDLSNVQELVDETAPEITHINKRELVMVVRGMVERLMLYDGMTIILGRGTGEDDTIYQVDLRPYDASQRGVSRQHASIDMHDGTLYLTDLGSTNGTWLAGKRIEPHQPAPINKGDEIILGRLVIQVLFRTSSSGKLRP